MNPLSPPSLPFCSSLPFPLFLVFLALVPAERSRVLLAPLLPRVERDLDLDLELDLGLALLPRPRDVRLVAVLRRPGVCWRDTALDSCPPVPAADAAELLLAAAAAELDATADIFVVDVAAGCVG